MSDVRGPGDEGGTGSDIEVLLRRLRELAAKPSRQAEDDLFAALGNGNWRVRKVAAEGIIALGPSKKNLVRLIEQLADPENAGLRNAAAEVLVGFGDASLPFVRKAVTSEDPDVRIFCCIILGQIGLVSSLPDLIRAIADPVENVRTAAIENLGYFRVPEASDALISVLEKGDLPEKFAALEALANQGAHIPYKVLRSLLGQSILRKAVFDVMSNGVYSDAIEEMAGGLSDTARSIRESALRAFCATVQQAEGSVRERAIGLIRAQLDPVALKRITQALESDDQSVRRAAVRVLGASGNPEVLPHLLELGSDEGVYQALREALANLPEEAGKALLEMFDSLEPKARAVAALAFGKMGYHPALPLLHRCLRSDFGHLLRASAEAVGDLGDEQSISDLVGLLSHPYPDVRDAAMRALGSIGTDNAGAVMGHLGEGLEATDPLVRAAAVFVVGQVAEDEDGLNKLSLALGDVDPRVRAEAAKALAAAQFAEAGGALSRAVADEDPAVRRTVAYALGSYGGEEGRAALKIALHDPDLWVRCEAVRSLGRMGDPASLTLLEEVLDAPTLHPVVGARALEALEQVAPAQAAAKAAGLLASPEPDVLLAALAVLGRTPPQDLAAALGPLSTLLRHEHWNVRAHAAGVLAHAGTEEARRILDEQLHRERDPLVQKALRDALVFGEEG